MKARAAIHPALASGALCAAGCRTKKIIGLVPADTSGTRSTPEECAPPACTSGIRLSVYLAAVGRRTPSGMRSDCRRVEVESQTHFALRN